MLKSILFNLALLPVVMLMIGCAAPNLTDQDADRDVYAAPTHYSAGYYHKVTHVLAVPLDGLDHQLVWNKMNDYEHEESRVSQTDKGRYEVRFYDNFTKRVTHSTLGKEHMYFAGPRGFLRSIASELDVAPSPIVPVANFKAVFREDRNTVKRRIEAYPEHRGFTRMPTKTKGNAVTNEYVNGTSRLVVTETPKELTLIFEGEPEFIHMVLLADLNLLH